MALLVSDTADSDFMDQLHFANMPEFGRRGDDDAGADVTSEEITDTSTRDSVVADGPPAASGDLGSAPKIRDVQQEPAADLVRSLLLCAPPLTGRRS